MYRLRFIYISARYDYFSARALQLYKKRSIIVLRNLKLRYLRKLLLILFIFLGFTTSALAQQSRTIPVVGLVQSTIVRFYPNPATSVINFDFQKAYEQGYSIQIYNAILGRKMFEQ